MKTKIKSRKIISVILAILMAFTTLPITMSFAATSAKPISQYAVGDLITLGSYPQSEVTDDALIAQLNAVGGEWISYRYMSENVASDYMKYKDVTLNGAKYRAVSFTAYRYYMVNSSAITDIDYALDEELDQALNGYRTNTTYWFKYEPLAWRVLDPATGLVLSESIIDSQSYTDTYYGGYKDSAKTIYSNNYEKSYIRAWLNADFYNTAFSSADGGKITTATLENKAYSTSYSEYDSATTYDKVFLLTYADVQKAEYGFVTGTDSSDARKAVGTDYAKAQGLYVDPDYSTSDGKSTSFWCLRSAGYHSNADVYSVYPSGGVSHLYVIASDTYDGVRPALMLDSESLFHSFGDDHTPGEAVRENEVDSTCKVEGSYDEVVYCADCGAELSREEKVIDKLAHTPAEAVREDKTAATCTAEGAYDMVVYCSVCGDELSRESFTTPKLSHKADEAVTEKGTAPTCTAKGTDYLVVTCKVCGEELSRTPVEVAKLGHDYQVKETVAPTCTQKGYTVYECEACGTRYSDNFVEATGHDLEEIDFIAPTCQSEGKIVYGCACGYTEEVTLEKAPHTFDSDIATISEEYAVVTPATCQHEGYTTYICATCGATKVGAYTPKTAHTYSASPVAKTCTTKGYTVYTCECGDCYKGDYTAANGHTDSNGDYVCDDCGAELARPHVARCSWCDKADQNFIYAIIHFFIHAFTAR